MKVKDLIDPDDYIRKIREDLGIPMGEVSLEDMEKVRQAILHGKPIPSTDKDRKDLGKQGEHRDR